MEEPEQPIRTVIIADVDVPFASMVKFMIKWAIASIPALIILLIAIGLIAAAIAVTAAGVIMGPLMGKDEARTAAAARPPSDRTSNDPSGIQGSGNVYLDGATSLFHEPGCPAIAGLDSPPVDRRVAKEVGYLPHSCVEE